MTFRNVFMVKIDFVEKSELVWICCFLFHSFRDPHVALWVMAHIAKFRRNVWKNYRIHSIGSLYVFEELHFGTFLV